MMELASCNSLMWTMPPSADLSSPGYQLSILFTHSLLGLTLCLTRDLLNGDPFQNHSSLGLLLGTISWTPFPLGGPFIPVCSPSSYLSQRGSSSRPFSLDPPGMSCAPVTVSSDFNARDFFQMILGSPPHLAWRKGREAHPSFPSLCVLSISQLILPTPPYGTSSRWVMS